MEAKYLVMAICLIGILILLGILRSQLSKKFLCDLCGEGKAVSSIVCLPSTYQKDIEYTTDHFWCAECAENFGLHVNAILCADGSYQKISFPTTIPKHEPPAKT